MNSKPSFVGVTPLPLRLKIVMPSSFSSSCNALVKDGCAIYSCSEALLSEPSSQITITYLSCCIVMTHHPK